MLVAVQDGFTNGGECQRQTSDSRKQIVLAYVLDKYMLPDGTDCAMHSWMNDRI